MAEGSEVPVRVRIGAPAAIVLFLAATVATLVLGVALSQQTGDWMWLSRAGSVLVVLGIVFAYFNIDGFIERGVRRAARGLTRRRRQDEAAPTDWVVAWLAEEPSEIPTRVKALEVSVIALGTLIWGFGDLVGWGF